MQGSISAFGEHKQTNPVSGSHAVRPCSGLHGRTAVGNRSAGTEGGGVCHTCATGRQAAYRLGQAGPTGMHPPVRGSHMEWGTDCTDRPQPSVPARVGRGHPDLASRSNDSLSCQPPASLQPSIIEAFSLFYLPRSFIPVPWACHGPDNSTPSWMMCKRIRRFFETEG